MAFVTSYKARNDYRKSVLLAGALPALLFATLTNPDAGMQFLERAAMHFNTRGAQILHQDMRDFRLSFTQADCKRLETLVSGSVGRSGQASPCARKSSLLDWAKTGLKPPP